MKEYTPRRANLKRWLQDAPPYILDCFDSKNCGERYTVVFTKKLSSATGSFADTCVSFPGMSDGPTHPQGVSMWGEMEAYKWQHTAIASNINAFAGWIYPSTYGLTLFHAQHQNRRLTK